MEIVDIENIIQTLKKNELSGKFKPSDKVDGILTRHNFYRLAQELFTSFKGLTNDEIFNKNLQKEQFKTKEGCMQFQKKFEKWTEKNKIEILAKAYQKAVLDKDQHFESLNLVAEINAVLTA